MATELVEAPKATPLEKLDAAVIAPKPTRKRRAAAFHVYVLVTAAAFVALAVAAHFVPYFRIDVTVAHALQGYRGGFFAWLMVAVSWIGFVPQVYIFGAAAVLALLLAGLWWEAVAAIFASCGVGIATLIKLLVVRPRPSADLVEVFANLSSKSFPSGHVVMITTVCGFLAFLVYTLLKPSWERTSLLVAAAIPIALMGPSRIYLGQHWFSDVMGAYLLGSLWLSLTIMFYRWGKLRFFSHQPVAPEAPPLAAERSA